MSIQEKFEENAEFTYGVHAGYMAEHIKDNAATIMDPSTAKAFLKKLDGGMMGSVRSLNQKLNLLRQAIAYNLPYKFAPDGTVLFLVYQRNKLNNEGQLTMKLSLAPAGHVTNFDVKNYFTVDEDRDPLETEIICLTETLYHNLGREFGEEVELTSQAYSDEHNGKVRQALEQVATDNAYPIGFVMDSKPDPKFVGNIHFGAIFASYIPYSDTTFEMKEEHNTAIGWASAVQLLDHVNGVQSISEGAFFEPWSTMIIQNIAEVVGTIKAVAGL